MKAIGRQSLSLSSNRVGSAAAFSSGLKVAAVGLILTVSGGPWGFAAGQETSTQQQPEVVIRATVNLVSITATVFDSQGRNVAGLRKEDFPVYEDNTPQTISVLLPRKSHLVSESYLIPAVA